MDSPAAGTPTKKERLSIGEGVIVFAAVALGIFLINMLIGFHGQNTDVADAQKVSDRIIHDLQTQNANDAYSLSDPSLHKTTSEAQMVSVFKASAPLATGKETIVKKALEHTNSGKAVTFIYKFTGKTKPLYIRTVLEEANGKSKWLLVNLGGDANESKVL